MLDCMWLALLLLPAQLPLLLAATHSRCLRTTNQGQLQGPAPGLTSPHWHQLHLGLQLTQHLPLLLPVVVAMPPPLLLLLAETPCGLGCPLSLV
jgi:hypothetical protein